MNREETLHNHYRWRPPTTDKVEMKCAAPDYNYILPKQDSRFRVLSDKSPEGEGVEKQRTGGLERAYEKKRLCPSSSW